MNELFQFLFPGLMLMWICFIANGVFGDIFMEYKSNTFSRLVSNGVTLGEFLLSKILRCLMICWICEWLLILFTGMVFQVNWWNNPLLLAVVLTSYNLFIIGLLAAVYGSAKTSDSAYAILSFIFLISSLIGGSFVPFEQLPKVIQQAGRWTMIRLGNAGIQSLFESRAPWDAVRPSLLLSGSGLGLMGIGMLGLRRRLKTGRVK